MKRYESKQFEMLLRAREWGLKHGSMFKPESMGRQTVSDIVSFVDDLKRISAQQSRGINDERRWTKNRAKARQHLWDFLRAMHRTARAIDQNSGGFRSFPLPRGERDHALLISGHAFLQAAAPLASHFIAYEMGEDFLARLQTAIENLRRAIREQQAAKTAHMSATVGIPIRMKKALLAVKRMDTIIRNRVPNVAVVQAWKRASRIERPGRAGGFPKKLAIT
jgi:hypothetical protein